MAYGQNQIDNYRKNAVNTASPLQLVVMLYDGSLRFMAQARQAIIDGNVYEQNRNCQKAQNIITELLSTLDLKRGGDVAQNLMALYNYTYDRLIEANINDNLEAIDQATKVMSELRASWAELESNQRNSQRAQEEVHAA